MILAIVLTAVSAAAWYAAYRMLGRSKPGDFIAVVCVALLFLSDAVAARVEVIWR